MRKYLQMHLETNFIGFGLAVRRTQTLNYCVRSKVIGLSWAKGEEAIFLTATWRDLFEMYNFRSLFSFSEAKINYYKIYWVN